MSYPSLHKIQETNFNGFVRWIENDLANGTKHTRKSVEQIAKQFFSITDKTEVKELTELAIVNIARRIAATNEPTENKYAKIVSLYNRQINLSHRTSQSVLLQQYSTPAPISYLMGVFVGLPQLAQNDGYALEPSAGNGLLTIAANPDRVYVNEIDPLRNRNLKTQGFKHVTAQDASDPKAHYGSFKKFDAVLTNPPFGTLRKAENIGTFRVNALDHLMSIRALDMMKDTGRAAIIVGGHTKWDNHGRIQKGKNRIFFNYLYHHYNVLDVIQIDGHKLYSRQGTAFPVRLILIAGRKETPDGAAPLKRDSSSNIVNSFEDLYFLVKNAFQKAEQLEHERMITIQEIEQRARELRNKLGLDEDLGAIYKPGSQSSNVLNTQVPDSMSFETQSALARVKKEVGGDIDNFVRHRLGYSTRESLGQVFSAEQIDALAMAIYNIEAKDQAMIIGDQTGIGKGRIAAGMIRYGARKGLKPIFITEKANLFSDIYRDLAAIGSGHLRPFIINSKDAKTDIKDEDGEVVYEALSPIEQREIFESEEIPDQFDFVVGTYSQFNSSEKKPIKPNFLRQIAKGNLLILDESHNASGAGNTGRFLQSVVTETAGVTFLSATFAKTPSNMPIYAAKTSIQEANLSKEGLIRAVHYGGVALQEILSSQLVAEGQMIRRERSYEGIEVNYIQLDEYEQQHKRTSDKITNILRYIIAFQESYVDKKIEKMDEEVAESGKHAAQRGGTNQAGVDSLPYFSKVFNVINQMLFSIKAEAAADRAIMRLKEGKKPVIAFSSTMGSFIEQMVTEEGQSVSDGETIRTDFSEVLRKGLDGILRYTVYDIDGKPTYDSFDPRDLGQEAFADYNRILEEIDTASTGISISPIDVIIDKIEKAGYSVGEVTGRKYSVVSNDGSTGTVKLRKKLPTNDAFRKFNNNELDVLLINQSGSTGGSIHAIPTSKVPKEEVKQRVMVILQPELKIDTEIQKRGRINRTGQILKPIYDYITSAIPAEKRLMMMLQKKLKSLDANTTSNQKQSAKILDVPDFLNKYGDKLVKEYLAENPEIDKLLGNPLGNGSASEDGEGSYYVQEASHVVSGRVAILSTKMQAEFYNDMTERYNDYVEYLKQVDEYDLEVEAIDLKAETKNTTILKMGKGGDSAFGDDSILETVEANVLKKPYKAHELEKLINEALAGNSAEDQKKDLLSDLESDYEKRIETEIRDTNLYYDNIIKGIPEEKKIKRLIDDTDAFLDAMELRRKQVEKERETELEMLKSGKSTRLTYIKRLINFFTVGKRLAYPLLPRAESDNVLAVCLGIVINKKKKNPYARSAVKIRIAVANGLKYITIPASRQDSIDAIISRSHDLEGSELSELLVDWESEIRSRTKNRTTRYIVTGNILQAFADLERDGGKLVSYTTQSGEIKKGILLPEDWKPKPLERQQVTVPILKAIQVIQNLAQGLTLNASDQISLIKINGGYRVIVPATKSKGGDIYLDQDIWPLIEKNKWEMVSGKMVAVLPDKNIRKLAEVLQDNHSVSMELNLNQLELVDKSSHISTRRKPIMLPPNEDEKELERIRILEIEAKALTLRLKLAS
jgi:predicted RNA methylase